MELKSRLKSKNLVSLLSILFGTLARRNTVESVFPPGIGCFHHYAMQRGLRPSHVETTMTVEETGMGLSASLQYALSRDAGAPYECDRKSPRLPGLSTEHPVRCGCTANVTALQAASEAVRRWNRPMRMAWQCLSSKWKGLQCVHGRMTARKRSTQRCGSILSRCCQWRGSYCTAGVLAWMTNWPSTTSSSCEVHDFFRCREHLKSYGIQDRIAPQGIEHNDQSRRYRWMVERMHAWLAAFGKPRVIWCPQIRDAVQSQA